MTAQQREDWGRVREVFEAALAHPTERRRAFVAESCRSEPAIYDQVVALLASHDHASAFLETSAAILLGSPREDIAFDGGADPNVGRVIGPYFIESCIGHGGMGAVYLARRADHAFERRVAIKMIRRGMDSDVVIRRFQHERQILASLDHPHIARLFDGGTTPEGLPHFVMEYVEGTPIDRYADTQRLTTNQRIDLCLGVLEAVQHAHDHLIVHRDLKPSNVLVTANGSPKLLDFGIAKILDPDAQGDSALTSLARVMTPDYASPEQVRGEPVTPATDVYALGLLLYELLTGHRPYRLATCTQEEIARLVCERDPPRPSAIVSTVETLAERDGTAATITPEMVSRYARRLAGVAAATAGRRARRDRLEGAAEGAGRAISHGCSARRRPATLFIRSAGVGRARCDPVSCGASSPPTSCRAGHSGAAGPDDCRDGLARHADRGSRRTDTARDCDPATSLRRGRCVPQPLETTFRRVDLDCGGRDAHD